MRPTYQLCHPGLKKKQGILSIDAKMKIALIKKTVSHEIKREIVDEKSKTLNVLQVLKLALKTGNCIIYEK